jgi:putative oxidoreductase
MLARILFLEDLDRFSDLGVLALRALTGGFLIYGVMDNVVSAERMSEFADFLAANGFAAPRLMAPLSVYAQLICGIAFVLGLFTRWAGLATMFNFIVAVVMVHASEDFRSWWPAIVLVAIGFHLAVAGAGKWSADRALGRA